MKLPRRQFLQLAAGAAALPAVSQIVRAQAYPTRPMTMVVPYSAGGPTDTIARIMAERMRTSIGQIIIVENTTGAAGTIGVGRVARAAPDGYTICIGHWGTHVVNGAIYELQYHVFNDFEPVSLIATNPQLIVARKTVPAKDLKELIAWLKIPVRALPRRRPRDAGPCGRPNRHHDRPGRQFHTASACRHDQGLCRDGQDPPGGSARHSDRGRGRRAVAPFGHVVRRLQPGDALAESDGGPPPER